MLRMYSGHGKIRLGIFFMDKILEKIDIFSGIGIQRKIVKKATIWNSSP